MKKRIFSLLLCAALSCASLPFAASVSAAPAEDALLLDGCRLVTFGDSLTAMGTWTKTLGEEMNLYAINSGVGGDTTEDGLARFDWDVTKKDPDIVIIGFGTNDDVRLNPGSSVPRVSPEKYKENLKTIISQVRALDADPILLTPPYVREDAYGPAENYASAGGLNAALDVYVEIVREVAKETDTGLIDIHKICDQYKLEEFLITDGVHLADLGNRVYVDSIEAYLKEHYRVDPDAPRIELPQPPEVEEGYWTKSVIPFTADGWRILKPDTVVVTEESDGSISFANTTGLWPEAHYSPEIQDTVAVPVENSYLTVNFETAAITNMVLYLNGSTPTVAYDQNFVGLIPHFVEQDPTLKTEEVGDLSANQKVNCKLKLSDIIPDNMVREDGTVLISGLKLYVVGAAGRKITFHEFSVTNPDPATLPKEAVYEDVVSLLPTDESLISRVAGGVADYSVDTDGSLHLSRAQEDTLSWPSIDIQVNKEVDLAETPYLHVVFTCDGGSANGFLYYTIDGGAEQSVQLSDLLTGTVNDFTSGQKLYFPLENKLGTTGKLTVTHVSLSVYGAPGNSLHWTSLAFSKMVREAEPAPEQPGETSDTSSDASEPTSDASSDAASDASDASEPTSEEPSADGSADESSDGSHLLTGTDIALIVGGASVLLFAVACVIGVVIKKRKKS